jgi:two-component system, NtrC family, sensor kinase
MPQYSYTDIEEKLARAQRERDEALEQQRATAEVLRVISSSPGELEPVFQALLENAVRICEANFGGLFLYEGVGLHFAAGHNVPPAFAEVRRRGLFHPPPGNPVGDVIRTKQTAHVADLAATGLYVERHPATVTAVELGGVRTVVAVPMLKDNELIGVIAIFRQEVRPFTDKQIELVTTFADQAVIAIENVRLFDDVQKRTRELTESLEQQTATSEVLQVISSSLTDTQPVFDAIVHSGLKLFPDAAIAIALPDGDRIRAAAIAERDPERVEAWKGRFPHPLSRDYMHGTAILDRRLIDVPDAEAHAAGPFATGVKNFLASGYRAITIMPMIRGDAAIGAMSVARLTPGPLSAKQIELLRTFADQAVIAIENVRLFDAEQRRTRDLSESLQQQTATADVLKVISRSTFDLQVVLDTLLSSAIRLCGTEQGMIFRYDGDSCRAVSAHNLPPEFLELWERTPVRAGRETTVGRALLECRPVQIVDVRADPEYAFAEAHCGRAPDHNRAIVDGRILISCFQKHFGERCVPLLLRLGSVDSVDTPLSQRRNTP